MSCPRHAGHEQGECATEPLALDCELDPLCLERLCGANIKLSGLVSYRIFVESRMLGAQPETVGDVIDLALKCEIIFGFGVLPQILLGDWISRLFTHPLRPQDESCSWAGLPFR